MKQFYISDIMIMVSLQSSAGSQMSLHVVADRWFTRIMCVPPVGARSELRLRQLAITG